MLCENSAATMSTEPGAQLVRHVVRNKLVGAARQLQIRFRNLDVSAKRRPRRTAANGTMADADVCRCGLKRESNFVAETVSREHFSAFAPPVIYPQD